MRQLLTESVLLSAGGRGRRRRCSRWLAVRGWRRSRPSRCRGSSAIAVDGRVLAFTAAIAILTGLVFGLLPAWRGGAAGAQRTLAVDSRGSVGGRSRARAALVVADLALALVLLAGAGLMLRTVVALTHATPASTPSGS